MSGLAGNGGVRRGSRGIAFFDLDHTLVDGDSDTSFLDFLGARGLLATELLAAKEPIHSAYLEGGEWQLAYRLLLERIFAGRSIREAEAQSAEHASKCVLPMLFVGARGLIARERARRDQLCLLTTTNQLVTRPIADALGMDALLSTRLETEGEHFTGRLVGDFCTGPGKAAALLAHCAAAGVDPADCAMFGDGRSDMEALDAVGEPVAVHPTRALRERALARGWRILDLSGG